MGIDGIFATLATALRGTDIRDYHVSCVGGGFRDIDGIGMQQKTCCRDLEVSFTSRLDLLGVGTRTLKSHTLRTRSAIVYPCDYCSMIRSWSGKESEKLNSWSCIEDDKNQTVCSHFTIERQDTYQNTTISIQHLQKQTDGRFTVQATAELPFEDLGINGLLRASTRLTTDNDKVFVCPMYSINPRTTNKRLRLPCTRNR